MAVSIVPALLAALVTQGQAALADRLVVYGFGVTDASTSDILMVGVDDPDNNLSAASSSEAEQKMATAGTPRSRDDIGSVTCAALSWRGGTDQSAAVNAAYTTFEAVATLLRADPSLGLATSGYKVVVCEVGSHRLSTNQYTDGCDAIVIFTVNFNTRI